MEIALVVVHGRMEQNGLLTANHPKLQPLKVLDDWYSCTSGNRHIFSVFVLEIPNQNLVLLVYLDFLFSVVKCLLGIVDKL